MKIDLQRDKVSRLIETIVWCRPEFASTTRRGFSPTSRSVEEVPCRATSMISAGSTKLRTAVESARSDLASIDDALAVLAQQPKLKSSSLQNAERAERAKVSDEDQGRRQRREPLAIERCRRADWRKRELAANGFQIGHVNAASVPRSAPDPVG